MACTSSGHRQKTDSAGDFGGQLSDGSFGQGGVISDTGGRGGSSNQVDANSYDGDITSKGWELVWSDEFLNNAVDSAYWNHEVNCWGGGNNEQECYVADAKNSFVSNGLLNIVALADNPSGLVGGPENDPTIVSKPYSSGRLNTSGLADWKYGRIEARARLPFGQGLWPAIWMLPAESLYGAWAQSGEIDIMEAVNLGADNNTVYGTLQYGAAWPNNVSSGTHYDLPVSAWDTFHVYAIEWEEGEIRWFVDDVHYATQRNWYSKDHPYPAPFDQRFYLVLNVAVGGAWPGPANAQTTFPQTMLVDYVRVYRCSHDPQTGKGCGTSDPSVLPLAGVGEPDR
jgi:beta-glucanase (GH16 family)